MQVSESQNQRDKKKKSLSSDETLKGYMIFFPSHMVLLWLNKNYNSALLMLQKCPTIKQDL